MMIHGSRRNNMVSVSWGGIMDLVGLFLISAVLVFGSVYSVWVFWGAWKEARVIAWETKTRGGSVSVSTWVQHGLTLLVSGIFFCVALVLCFSLVQGESYTTAVGQLKSLTGPTSVSCGKAWGRGANQGTLHVAPTSDGERVTGASIAYIEFDNSDLGQLLDQYPEIEWFILSGTQIDDRGLRLLAERENLDALVLTDTTITDYGIALFRGHCRLREVDLTRTKITDRTLDVIRSWPALEHLNLSETDLTTEGLKALRGKKGLRTLNIQGTHVSDEAIPTLVSLPDLILLQARNSEVSAAGFAELKRALPECEICPMPY